MSQEYINVGPAPNDGLGDPIRTAFIKTNNNFSHLYSIPQDTPPPTLIGSVGDFAGMYAYDSTYFYYCFADYTTGNSAIWAQLTQAGNLSVTAINNGNSNVTINGSGANAIINIGGVANIAVFATTGVYLSGVVSAAGNVRGGNINTVGQITADGNITGNYILGNGSQLTGLPATYSDANVAAYLPTYTGNVGSGNLLSSGLVSATGNITGGNILTVGNVNSRGQVSATGDIITSGMFIGTFAGNVTGNFVVPGANTQVIFNTNGNADAVGGMTYNKGSNTFIVLGVISSQGNTIGGNLLTSGLVSATGTVTSAANITGGNLLTTGLLSTTGTITSSANITGGNVLTSGLISATSTITSSANITGGNVLTSGLISATGNVTGGNILTGGRLSAAGNISGNYLSITNDINIGGNISLASATATVVSASGNVTGGNILTGGLISATGNVSGNYLFGNGSQLTGLAATYGNSNVTTLLSAFGSNSISTTGTVTASSVVGGVITGSSSSVTGTQTAASTVGGVITGSSASVSGNITGGNILTGGLISSTGNITGGNLIGTVYTNNIVNSGSNATGNIGSSSTYFNTVFATATTALYADLAECYLADAEYAPGTVLCFEGSAEVTQCNSDMCVTVAGVVSTKPAYQMNSGLTGDHVVAMALTGRVPCQVKGPVKRGSMMVSAGNGRARAEANPAMGTVIGKALETFNGDTGTIEIVVGRL